MDLPPQPPEQVIEQRLVDCGLDRKGLSISYSDLLQGIEIVIAPSANATVEHFGCIRTAAAGEIVTFQQGNLANAYADSSYELIRPQMLESARKSLAERGLLQGLPERKDYQDEAEFAKALEVHCGFKPGSVIQSTVSGMTILPLAMPKGPMTGPRFEKFSGLLAALMYFAARDGDIKIGFIGNEAYREADGK